MQRMRFELVGIMRVNRTYSIDFQTIADLNNTISAKHRSKFVDKAIKNRLKGMANYDLEEINILELLNHLMFREELAKSHQQLILTIYKEVEP